MKHYTSLRILYFTC